MPALNHVQLIGRLGKDPESKFTPTGKKVTHFRLAVSQRWKTNGEMKEFTEWVNIEVWGRLGEVCQEYLKKGSLVYLEGRLKTEKYDDKGGDTKYFTKVVTQMVQFLPDSRAGDTLDAHVDLHDLDNENEEEEDFETAEVS